MFLSQTNSTLPAYPDFVVAITAIHRSTLTGLERYFSVLATIRAHCREHLASRSVTIAIISIAVATVSVLACFPCLAAFGATLGLVSITSRLELFLFLSAEGETSPAVGTVECLVLKTHWMTSSLTNLVGARAIQYLISICGDSKKLASA
jgi:hypothetical protein